VKGEPVSIPEIIRRRGFAVTVEMNAPKGTDTESVLHAAEQISLQADAINVTDGPSAMMRMGPLALCHLLRDRGIEPVLQLTCRDRNRIALQAELLGACALGITNVLCLTGDHVGMGDHPEARACFDLDSVALLETLRKLGGGTDLKGNPLTGPARLCPGAAVNPNAFPIEPQLLKMRRKLQAGAQFIQTQVVFDASLLEPFVRLAREAKVPLIMGVLVLSSPGSVRFVNEHVSGLRVPEELGARIGGAADPAEAGVKIAAELVLEAHSICDGVHLMNAGPERVKRVVQEAGLKRKR